MGGLGLLLAIELEPEGIVYVGGGGFDHANIRVERPGHAPEALPPRHDLANHSPTGLAWGYGGSGPAQTALAILAHATGDDELAMRHHQDFKFSVVAQFEWPKPFRLGRQQVLDWVAKMES